MAELAGEEGGESMHRELEHEIEVIRKDIASAEVAALLSGERDASNAIVSIHPGAGGTEAQDWAEMLMRMYLRWAEKHGYKTEILDYQSGEEAGVKSVTFTVSGDYTYGRLKAEAGVHRLVRISPFDANKRRHTSFASVYVYPEVEDDIDDRDRRKGPPHRHLPGVKRGRAAREQDRFRGQDHTSPHQYRSAVPERTVAAQEQERCHESPEIAAV